jgi:hypothetical protein
VVRSGKVPFKDGMLLIEAIQGQGADDRTPFGGRKIEVTRTGKLHTLDYRKEDALPVFSTEPGILEECRFPKIPENCSCRGVKDTYSRG